MHEQAVALNVAQELRAQACALASALDQSGNVSDDEADLVGSLSHYNHAKVRLQSCERVISNLRTCGRDARNQSALAGVRETHQTDIGEQLQLQPKGALLAGETRL